MGRKIIGVVALVIVLIVAAYLYNNWKIQNTLGNGDVFQETPKSSSNSYTQPNSTASPAVPAPATTSNQPPGGAPAPAMDNSTVATGTSTALPASDSQAPNNPDNVRIGSAGGSSRYQWYRQGNLTWRVDTQTGANCIAFATDEEWRKPRVYEHGCGNH